MPVALTMQQPSWDLLSKVSEGHGATLCLENQSWNSSPSCPDVLLLPNDTDETRSSALCVTAAGTIPQPCDTSACSGSVPVSAGAAQGAASQPSQTLQSKPPPAAPEPPGPSLPQPSLQHWQQSLVLFTPFPFFFLFPLNASFLVLSTCTCRAGNPPAQPGWGPQDPWAQHQDALGEAASSCSDLSNGTKPWLQHPRKSRCSCQDHARCPRSCPDHPSSLVSPVGFDTAALLGFPVPPGQWDKKWLSPWQVP